MSADSLLYAHPIAAQHAGDEKEVGGGRRVRSVDSKYNPAMQCVDTRADGEKISATLFSLVPRPLTIKLVMGTGLMNCKQMLTHCLYTAAGLYAIYCLLNIISRSSPCCFNMQQLRDT